MQRVLFLLFFLPATSFANCTQEQIEFYLDKGFNQEQITKLCTTGTSESSEASSYEPYQKPVVIIQEGSAADKTGFSADERKAITTLRGGIDARSVDITPEAINYIRKVCVQLKESPDVNKWFTKCFDVAFSISRNELKVNESGKGQFLFGQTGLVVSSAAITRKQVTSDPWAGLLPDVKFKLKRKYEDREKGNTTRIQIRNTADPNQMVSAIRTLADATVARQTGEDSSEVARILDDTYVPPTQDEYLASQESYEEALEEKKEKKEKKKKWWNPFD